jgi:hypothetical protein
LIRLKGIGVNLVSKMESKVKDFLKSGGAIQDLYSIPISAQLELAVSSGTSAASGSISENQNSTNAPPPPKKSKKSTVSQKASSATEPKSAAPAEGGEEEQVTVRKRATGRRYEPAYRSGAYGLLMCLFEHACRDINGLSKSQLIDNAQQYCDVSYRDPLPGGNQYYTGNMLAFIS